MADRSEAGGEGGEERAPRRPSALDEVLAGRYRVERKLGEGGMAEVFLVHDMLDGRPLALKRLKAGEPGRDYFMHEFQVLARLDHPNLVRVFDLESADPATCFYTCEYLDGKDLFQATRGVDWDGLWEVVRQVLDALGYIHDRGLVHYDVKPENVNVAIDPPARPGARPTFRVKLVDFGLTGEATTRRGEKIKGTVHYVSPEVAKSLPADRRADLYSLGISLYYVVTGRLPYDGGSALSIITKHLEKVPDPPSSIRPDVPEAWARFVLRLIEKDPAKRPASAPEALADLARRLGKPPPAADATAGGTALAPGFVGRGPLLASLVELLPRVAKRSKDDDDDDDAPATPPVLLGGPCVVWLEGEEGSGKTRLTRELKVRAQVAGVPVLEASCLGAGDRPFERLLRLALTLPGARLLAEGARAELLRVLPGAANALLPGGPSTTGGLDDASEDARRLDHDRVADLLLAIAAQKPYVLVLEDLRRGDEATTALLAAVVRSLALRDAAAPLVILTDRTGAGRHAPAQATSSGAGRTPYAARLVPDLGPLPDRPQQGAPDMPEAGLDESGPAQRPAERAELDAALALLGPAVQRRALGRLDEEATTAMVASMLALPDPALEPSSSPGGSGAYASLGAPSRSTTLALGKRVHEVTGGNPLFVEALVRSLVEDGVLALRRVDLSPDALRKVEPPRSLGELLGLRLQRLAADPRAVLTALAVLGAPSSLRVVAGTAELTPARTLDALDALVRDPWVARDDDEEGGPPRYRLSHGLVSRAVLESIDRDARALAHRRALSALESNAVGERVAGRLARHAHQAGAPAEALRWSVAAGLDALAQGRPHDAIEHLGRALELLRWEDTGAEGFERRRQEVLVLTRLSEVLATVGRTSDAARSLEELLGLGDDVLGPQAAVAVRRRLGDLALRQGRSAEGRRWLQDALAAAGDAVDRRTERARALEVMSRVALWRGDYLQVIALAGEAAAIYKAQRRDQDAPWALHILSTAEYYRGRVARAAELLDECVALGSKEHGLRGLLRRHGHDDAAQARLEPLLRPLLAPGAPQRREAGETFGLALSFTDVGTCFDLRAPAEVALRFYEASLDAYRRLGDVPRAALAQNNLGVQRRLTGSLGPALEDLERALALHDSTGDRHGGAVALVNVALLRLGLGDAAGAQERAARVLGVARDLGVTWLTGHCHRVVGRALAAQGAHVEADRELQRGAGVFGMIGNQRSLGDLLLDRAEVAVAARRPDDALALLARARATMGDEDRPADAQCRQRLVEGELALRADGAPAASKAVDAFEAALRHAKVAGVVELALDAHRALAAAYARLQSLRLAHQHHEQAQALEDRLTAGVEDDLRERLARTPGFQRARDTARRLAERLLDG